MTFRAYCTHRPSLQILYKDINLGDECQTDIGGYWGSISSTQPASSSHRQLQGGRDRRMSRVRSKQTIA